MGKVTLATAIKTRAADYAVKKRQQKIRELLQGILISHQDPPLSLTEVARVHHIGLATLCFKKRQSFGLSHTDLEPRRKTFSKLIFMQKIWQP